MTNEEEKILEEEKDITLEQAAEEAEELQEETQDEVKEVREEIPEDVRLDPDEIRERPVLRDGGLRDAADPNMIQTHLDNFLAKIAGETPADDNVRNSHEYWLDRIADRVDGIQDEIDDIPSQKKLYWHGLDIYITPVTSFNAVVLSDSATPLNSMALLLAWFDSISGMVDLSVNGVFTYDTNKTFLPHNLRKSADGMAFTFYGADYFPDTSSGYTSISYTRAEFEALGFNVVDRVNRIL